MRGIMNANRKHQLLLFSNEIKRWDVRPESLPAKDRREYAFMNKCIFKEFEDFAELGMKFLGFSITPMQRDICKYMQYSGDKIMVQAQRGEAKTIIVSLYSVWTIIQDQSTRVLVVSAGEKLANQIASIISKLIMQWHLLCYLRPDSTKGDRTAITNWDVHSDLKPLDKSASITSEGITSNLAGNRADLLIADDIESQKNSLTQTSREQLLNLSKEFAAINTHGKTIYLGTPQTRESIYRTLPARGYDVRIWCGRIPTADEEERYKGLLAPYILNLIEEGKARTGYGLDGTRGESADPYRYSEEDLISKELDFGTEGFQLQFMLDTSLVDAIRTRLKSTDLVIGSFGTDTAPINVWYSSAKHLEVNYNYDSTSNYKLYSCAGHDTIIQPYELKYMYIDPAGTGGDEVAYCIGGVLNGYLHVFSIGGLAGGLTDSNCDMLVDKAVEAGVSSIYVESNMGNGTSSAVIRHSVVSKKIKNLAVLDHRAFGQKEKRIVDTLYPVLRKHKLILHSEAIVENDVTLKAHAVQKRESFNFMYQLNNITTDRGSLKHDDRLDALAGLVQLFTKYISLNDVDAKEKIERKGAREFLDNPMGYDNAPRSKRRCNNWLVNKAKRNSNSRVRHRR